MKTSPLETFTERLVARRVALNAEFEPQIRAYFVELFRKAHAVEPKLTGMDTEMGTATANGHYSVTDEGETWEQQAHKWSPRQIAKSPHPEVELFLSEIDAYSDQLCAGRWDDLPGIDAITVQDLGK